MRQLASAPDAGLSAAPGTWARPPHLPSTLCLPQGSSRALSAAQARRRRAGTLLLLKPPPLYGAALTPRHACAPPPAGIGGPLAGSTIDQVKDMFASGLQVRGASTAGKHLPAEEALRRACRAAARAGGAGLLGRRVCPRTSRSARLQLPPLFTGCRRTSTSTPRPTRVERSAGRCARSAEHPGVLTLRCHM